MKKFPAFRPKLSDKSISNINQEIKDLSISGNFGMAIKEVEEHYSILHNNYFSVLCSSGTSALHLACLGLGINENSTVIVPASTNMATFFAPMYCGAKVIPCDVNNDNGLIDLKCLEKICLEQLVDLVIPVHLYGHVIDINNLLNLKEKYNFKIVEDCAEAHFASYENNGQFVGSYFDAGCFSFYANKIISCGEGGIVLFRNKTNANKAKSFKNLSFGSNNDISKFFHKEIGYNYRLSNLQAALLNYPIENRNNILGIRAKIENHYTSLFKKREYIEELPSQLSSYRVNWVYCIKIKEKFLKKFSTKKEFLFEIEKKGVEARDYFYPADKQDFLINYSKQKKYNFSDCKHALEFYERSIYLPVYEDLNKEDINEIVNIIDSVVL